MGGGRLDGEEDVGREEDKPPYRHFGIAVATWKSYKAPTMSRRRSWSNGSSFKSWFPNWCSPGAPFSSQGWQNALQKSRPVNIGQ